MEPSERVTVVIHSTVGEDGPLTVQDSLRQVLDFFDWLSSSVSPEDRESVAWNLFTISRNSPLEAVGEAIALIPGIDAGEVARRAKAVVANEMHALSNGGIVPDWMDHEARAKARAMMNRTLNGIGRTDLFLYEGKAPIIITERVARLATIKLDQVDLELQARSEDLSRRELGSIEGESAEPTTFYGRPAIRVRERLSNKLVICALSSDLARHVGPDHRWDEVWGNQRVLVIGELIYGKDGQVSRVNATELKFFKPRAVKMTDLAMPGFTGGVTAPEYLDWLWRGDLG